MLKFYDNGQEHLESEKSVSVSKRLNCDNKSKTPPVKADDHSNYSCDQRLNTSETTNWKPVMDNTCDLIQKDPIQEVHIWQFEIKNIYLNIEKEFKFHLNASEVTKTGLCLIKWSGT
ncbi:hypothetical protein RUM43_011235 [Polyplax serrata]|uniref:Uncharacterized protein n=1 Tax=Polyplax serrata TaxID=468196 RepID=A0AAN8NTE8_POLSC